MTGFGFQLHLLLLLVLAFGGGMALLMAAAQLFLTPRRLENLSLAALFLCVGALQLQFGIKYGAIVRPAGCSWLFLLQAGLLFPLGPLSLLYFRASVEADLRLRPRDGLHLLPALLVMLFELALFLLPGEAARSFRAAALAREIGPPGPFPLLMGTGFLWTLMYLSHQVRVLLRTWRPSEMTPVMRLTLSIHLYTGVFILLMILALLLRSPWLLKVGSLMVPALMYALYLIGYRHPELLLLFREELRKTKYARSKLKGLDVEDLERRLRGLMEIERVYGEEDISLQTVAGRLGVSPHQLSELLNDRIRMNFNTFVNHYRIEEAKRRLREEPGETVLSIAFRVGFNSRSTFNATFLNLTGTTPSKFRKS